VTTRSKRWRKSIGNKENISEQSDDSGAENEKGKKFQKRRPREETRESLKVE